jgi:hypothetical protein
MANPSKEFIDFSKIMMRMRGEEIERWAESENELLANCAKDVIAAARATEK